MAALHISLLVLLCHKIGLFVGDFRVLGFMQQGHRARRRARAKAMWMWSVAMEPGWWRCGRIGGSSGSETSGKGRFLEDSALTRS